MTIKFKNISALQRDRKIEGETGTELGLPGNITLHLLCASDANPRYVQFGDDFQAELRRLSRANANNDRTRKFLADWLTRLFIIKWEGVLDEDDNPVPFTHENCVEFLLNADDAIPAIQQVVYDTKNFRGARIEAVVDSAKN